MSKSFNANGWETGPAGFGTEGTPGAVIGTPWSTKDIWLRRTFKLGKPIEAQDLLLRLHHDDDVTVYVDGRLAFKRVGWTSDYAMFTWAGGKLAAGEHLIAVHCHQNEGGQFIDVGLEGIVR